MTHFWVWLSETCFTLCNYFEHKAIQHHVIESYQKALTEPTEHNLKKAQSALTEASHRLNNNNAAAQTVTKCLIHIKQLTQELNKWTNKIKTI